MKATEILFGLLTLEKVSFKERNLYIALAQPGPLRFTNFPLEDCRPYKLERRFNETGHGRALVPLVLVLENGGLTAERDIHVNRHDGETAIYIQRSFGTSEGHEAVVRLLVDSDCGADINVKCRDGGTALHSAASEGDEAVCYDQTALYTAAFAGHEAVVRLLVDRGADVNAKDSKGPAHTAPACDDLSDIVVKSASKSM
jgi:ankyrin repeat protein